jgi:hypothetical protein
MTIVPKGYFGCSIVGTDGFPTKMFFGVLFSDHEKGVKFLQETGLLPSEMTCPKCSCNMRRWECESVIGKYHWRCGKGGEQRNATRSLRHSSWFTESKLTLLGIMLMTYNIMQKCNHMQYKENTK